MPKNERYILKREKIHKLVTKTPKPISSTSYNALSQALLAGHRKVTVQRHDCSIHTFHPAARGFSSTKLSKNSFNVLKGILNYHPSTYKRDLVFVSLFKHRNTLLTWGRQLTMQLWLAAALVGCYYLSHTGLKYTATVLLPLPPKCCDYRCAQPHLAFTVTVLFHFWDGISCSLDWPWTPGPITLRDVLLKPVSVFSFLF